MRRSKVYLFNSMYIDNVFKKRFLLFDGFIFDILWMGLDFGIDLEQFTQTTNFELSCSKHVAILRFSIIL